MSALSPHLPGEVHFVDLNPVEGSEQGGRRPAVIVSVEATNRAWPGVVTVIACSGQVEKYRGSRLAVILPAGSPCPQETAVLPWQIRTISTNRLVRSVGSLDAQQLADVRARLKIIWGLS